MASSRKNKRVLLGLVLMTALSGCAAEYMNNWDRVSTRAGNAMDANTAIMEVVPSNADNTSTNVGS